ncbi:MAG: hypothetical protein VX730_08975 [Pseudomonadota bacterium]|nr:hypothetical protein [Pseudomonadota bacterium]
MTEEQLKARIAELEAKVDALENPEWPKAAPGCGALFYYITDDDEAFVLLSRRGTEHGEGYGITGGGFYSVKKATPYSLGSPVLTHELECFRELCEEFRDPGQNEDESDTLEQVMAKATAFTSLVPKKRFTEHAERLCGFVVQTPNDPHNQYHDCNFFAFQVTEKVAMQLMAIPANAERPETVAVPIEEEALVDVTCALFHKHEAVPIVQLLQYVEEKMADDHV